MKWSKTSRRQKEWTISGNDTSGVVISGSTAWIIVCYIDNITQPHIWTNFLTALFEAMLGLQVRPLHCNQKYHLGSVPGIPNTISVDCKGSLTLTMEYTIFLKLCIVDRVVAIKDKTIGIPKEYKYFLLFWWVSYFLSANRIKLFSKTKRKLAKYDKLEISWTSSYLR